MNRPQMFRRMLGAMACLALVGGIASNAHAAGYTFVDPSGHYYTNDNYRGASPGNSAGIFDSTLKNSSNQIVATGSVCNDLGENIFSSGNSTPINVKLVTSIVAADIQSPHPAVANKYKIAALLDNYMDTLKAFTNSQTVTGLAGLTATGGIDITDTLATYNANDVNAGFQQAMWSLWIGGPTGSSTDGTYGSTTDGNSVRDWFLKQANNKLAANYSVASNTAIWVYDQTETNEPQAPNFQSQLMVLNNPIPEPAFYQMSGLLVLGLVGVRRLRRKA